jgi:hypothetical protein
LSKELNGLRDCSLDKALLHPPVSIAIIKDIC